MNTWHEVTTLEEIPLTLGNLIGGSICTGMLLYATYGRMNKHAQF